MLRKLNKCVSTKDAKKKEGKKIISKQSQAK